MISGERCGKEGQEATAALDVRERRRRATSVAASNAVVISSPMTSRSEAAPDGSIREVRQVSNPDKLTRVSLAG
ncbi:hypothetical protein [Arthrobacter sp. StoSoilB20]|uniref:hypothetical protein n=1 Tax=Arthrobacter sp. StoSoilB20 TaxID=2830995 RepID=UPI001CC67AA0|nr:hypothetical protein [Arthrobacter sp. StoSoilB20]